MNPVALEIAGTGMVTALGASTRETIAALDRGERRTTQTHLVDLRGDRITGAFALPVRHDLTGAARAELLVLQALTECLDALDALDSLDRGASVRGATALDRGASVRARTALFVCAPLPWGAFAEDFAPVVAPVRDDWAPLTRAIATHLENRGHRGCSERPCRLHRGHAAGVFALCHIQRLFERGEATQAVIVGIDTHGDRATLERLDLAGLLKSRRSPGGFVPGEAAAVVCVRPVGRGEGEPGPATDAARWVVRGLGTATERERSSTALGLTLAVGEALSSWGGAAASVATVAIDLNGERERAKEWSFAATRTLWRERATPEVIHPADRLGDVGAATVPLLLALPAGGANRAGPALVVASSRGGLRGAVALERRGGCFGEG
jgi:3-oxoacyl-[acyl-carrier-protein] synthase-1